MRISRVDGRLLYLPVAQFVDQKENYHLINIRLVFNPLEHFYFTLLVHWGGGVKHKKGHEMNWILGVY